MIKKIIVNVEYEIRKYFLIYLFIGYSIFLLLSIFKDIDIFDLYMKAVDSSFYKISTEIGEEYNTLLKEAETGKLDVYNLTERYYEAQDSLKFNQYMLKYYFPGISIIGILLLAYIHVTVADMHMKKNRFIGLKTIQLSRVYPILSLILMVCIALTNVDANKTIIKIMENINMIIGFILITFGIVVSINLINTIQHKWKKTLSFVNIVFILIFPKLFWFLGIWGSIFKLKIVKKVGGKHEL